MLLLFLIGECFCCQHIEGSRVSALTLHLCVILSTAHPHLIFVNLHQPLTARVPAPHQHLLGLKVQKGADGRAEGADIPAAAGLEAQEVHTWWHHFYALEAGACQEHLWWWSSGRVHIKGVVQVGEQAQAASDPRRTEATFCSPAGPPQWVSPQAHPAAVSWHRVLQAYVQSLDPAAQSMAAQTEPQPYC